MKNFNRSRDRRGSSRESFGGRDSGRPSLHDAVCAECGRDCQVPFKPSGERPIYCSDCFERKGGKDSHRSDRRGSDRRNYGGRDRGRSPQSTISDHSMSQFVEKVDTLNAKLDTIIQLLSLLGEKKSGVTKGTTEQKKKVKKTEADKTTEAVAPVVENDTDSIVGNIQKDSKKTKPKKKVKVKKSAVRKRD